MTKKRPAAAFHHNVGGDSKKAAVARLTRAVDKEGIIHFEWHVGQVLDGGRYVLQKLLGEGTFGRVVSAKD